MAVSCPLPLHHAEERSHVLSGCIGSRRRDFDVKSYLFTYVILSDENEKFLDGRRSLLAGMTLLPGAVLHCDTQLF